MTEFKREQKYLVIKLADLQKYASNMIPELNKILSLIRLGREREGKRDSNYVVVNEDEPYAETVWALIKARWEDTEGIER